MHTRSRLRSASSHFAALRENRCRDGTFPTKIRRALVHTATSSPPPPENAGVVVRRPRLAIVAGVAFVGLVSLVAACGESSATSDDGGAGEDANAGDAGGDVDADADVDAGADAGADANARADVDAGAAACPDGATLRELLTACPNAPLVPSPALASALTSSATAMGDVIALDGLAEGTAPCQPVAVCTPNDAPSLLFSDSPEEPAQDGVLYADTVPAGRHRFYVYHANGSVAARKFPIVVLNQGAQDTSVTIRRRGLAAPSKAYVSVGKTVLLDWLAPQQVVKVVTVPAGTRVLLDPALDALHADKAELVHAIYDVETTASLKVSFVSVLANADAVAVTAGLPLLTRDPDHQRGTFANADVVLAFQADAPKNGIRHLRLGGDETDKTLTGIDAPTGDAQKLLGNYGVLYRVVATPKPYALAIAPRGGAWGGAARAVAKAAPLAGATALPKSAEVLGTTTEAIALGKLDPLDVGEVDLMTAGGSNLPIDLMITAP